MLLNCTFGISHIPSFSSCSKSVGYFESSLGEQSESQGGSHLVTFSVGHKRARFAIAERICDPLSSISCALAHSYRPKCARHPYLHRLAQLSRSLVINHVQGQARSCAKLAKHLAGKIKDPFRVRMLQTGIHFLS
jgi:hypothetical protein